MASPLVDDPSTTDGRGAADGAPLTAQLNAGVLVEGSCRALDIAVSLVLLAATSPLLLLLAIAVRLDSPGPAIFRQRRIGRGGKPFVVNKFRSMYVDVRPDRHREYVLGLINGDAQDHAESDESGDGAYYKMTADPRVTRVGRLLRRSSLDELPQLWNVLRGDMSLVGPRPPIPYEVEQYPPEWLRRLAVKPGITGLWQVSGRSTVTLEEMVRLDIEYAERRGVWLNVVILAKTVPAVLGADGAW